MVQTEPQYICIYKCVIAILDEMEAKREFAAGSIVPVERMTKEELEDALDITLDSEGNSSDDSS